MLTIDLIPATCWFNNLRKVLTKTSWDKLRKESYERAGHKCEICGGTGVFGRGRVKVECHELWDYKDDRQILTGLTSLCTVCHRVKHFGFSCLNGYEDMCRRQLRDVNKWTPGQVAKHINESMDLYEKRSQQDWTLDISWLKNKDISFKKEFKFLEDQL